jgi:hypothetical protein
MKAVENASLSFFLVTALLFAVIAGFLALNWFVTDPPIAKSLPTQKNAYERMVNEAVDLNRLKALCTTLAQSRDEIEEMYFQHNRRLMSFVNGYIEGALWLTGGTAGGFLYLYWLARRARKELGAMS